MLKRLLSSLVITVFAVTICFFVFDPSWYNMLAIGFFVFVVNFFSQPLSQKPRDEDV